jgi:hypothetical protein
MKNKEAYSQTFLKAGWTARGARSPAASKPTSFLLAVFCCFIDLIEELLLN